MIKKNKARTIYKEAADFLNLLLDHYLLECATKTELPISASHIQLFYVFLLYNICKI